MKKTEIDFVVTWLDSNDPEWQEAYFKYKPDSKGPKGNARFRNMDIFRYWFRAVELYAPWVNKVYLITNGKFPSRIQGLSEHFVYFNDDMYLNAPVKPEHYFKNGLPCDLNKETCYNVPIYTKADKFGIYMQMLADIGIINRFFNRKETVKQSPSRWFGPHLGVCGNIMSFLLLRRRLFSGFSNFHIEQAYLKSVFNEVWEAAPEFMSASCTRFREDVTANPYLFRYWQFAKNLFYPAKRKGLYFFLIKRDMLNKIEKAFQNNNYASICLNDSALCNDEEFQYINTGLQQLFENKFPQKSSFEI